MAEYDGAVRFNTHIDTKGIVTSEKEIEKHLNLLKIDAEEYAKTLKELEAQGKFFGDEDYDKVYLAWKNATNAVKEYRAELDQQSAKVQEVLKEEEAEQNRLAEIKKNATVSDDKMVSLLEREKALTQELKELKAAGVTEGYQEYDKTYIALENAKNAVKEYRAELEKQTESGQAKAAEEAAKALEKQEVAQRKIEEQAERNLQKENAKIQKEAENAAKLQAKEAERQAKLEQEAAEEQRLAQIRESAVVNNQHIIDVLERRKQILREIADMEKAGVGLGYQEYEDAQRELSALNQEIKDYSSRTGQMKGSYQSLGKSIKNAFGLAKQGLKDIPMAALKAGAEKAKSAFKALGNIAKKSVAGGIKSLGNVAKSLGTVAKSAFSKIIKPAKESNGLLSTMKSRFKGLAMSLLIFNQISKAFNAMISAAKEGFGNLYDDVSSFKTSVDSLKASALTLKNSFAAAFRPLVDIAIPYIQKAVDYMTQLLDVVGQFMAAITGQKTYTKAIKQTTAALEDEDEAQNKQLSGLDKLNNLSSGSSDSDDTSSSEMFEENVPINSSFLDMYQNLKDLIENEDWESIGDYIATALNVGLQKIYDILSLDNVSPKIASFVTAFAKSFNGLVDGFDWESLGKTIGAGIDTVVNTLNLLVTGIDWVDLGSGLARVLNGLADEMDFTTLGTLIGNKFMILPDILLGFVTNLDWEEVGDSIGNTLNGIVSAIDLSAIGEMLGKGLTGIFQAAINFSSTFDWVALGTNIYQGINSFFSNTDWATIGQGISDFVLGLLDALVTAIEGIDWAQMGESIKTMLANVDWTGIADRLFELIGAALGGFAAFIGGLIGDGIEAAKEYFQGKIEEAGGNVVAGIFTGIVDAIAGIGQWIYDHIFKPFIDGFKNVFGIHSPSTVMKEMGSFLMEGLLNGISSLVNSVKAIFNNIRTVISNVWNTVKTITSTVWNTIKRTVSNVWDGIKGAVSTAINAVKNTISNVMQKVKGIWNGIWEGLSEKVGGILNGIKSVIDEVFGWISEKVNWVLEKLGLVEKESVGLHTGGAFAKSGSVNIGTDIGAGALQSSSAIAALSSVDIPGYATGQVIPRSMKQHLAILGDNTRETEVVSPLSTIKQALREEALSLGLANNGAEGGVIELHLTVECEGYKLLKLIQKLDREQVKATGRPSFQI